MRNWGECWESIFSAISGGASVQHKRKEARLAAYPTENSRQISLDQPKEHTAPMGNNTKAPYWKPSPMGIEGKEKLGWGGVCVGNPDWQPSRMGHQGNRK